MSDNCWPDIPKSVQGDPQLEFKKLLYQAKLQVITAQQVAKIELAKENSKADKAYEYARRQALYSAHLDIAKGQLERAQARAEFVEKAASAIGAAYGVILGLAFNVSKDMSHLLPLRSLVPAFYLGLAIALAAIYLAYVTPTNSKSPSGILVQKDPSPPLDADTGHVRFIGLTNEIVLRRIPWLRSAIISLGFGVLSLPVAFLTIQEQIVGVVVVASLLIIFFPSIIIPLLSVLKVSYWLLKTSNNWPDTPQEAADRFGGTPDRWSLSKDKQEWFLSRGNTTEVNTHGFLAGGYYDEPVEECHVWVGKQTVLLALINRGLFPDDNAWDLAAKLLKNIDELLGNEKGKSKQMLCRVRLRRSFFQEKKR